MRRLAPVLLILASASAAQAIADDTLWICRPDPEPEPEPEGCGGCGTVGGVSGALVWLGLVVAGARRRLFSGGARCADGPATTAGRAT